MEHYTMTFTNKYTKITLETPKGKPTFLELHTLSLFLSLHYIKFLQYNIRFQPTSKTLILKLELENHGPKTPIPWTTKPLIEIPPKGSRGQGQTPCK